MSKIAYEDKVALNENPEVLDINKCKADDLNEIKTVVNANDDITGDLSNLAGAITSDNVVDAINKVYSVALEGETTAGNLADLETPVNTDLVSAVNSIYEGLGDVSDTLINSDLGGPLASAIYALQRGRMVAIGLAYAAGTNSSNNVSVNTEFHFSNDNYFPNKQATVTNNTQNPFLLSWDSTNGYFTIRNSEEYTTNLQVVEVEAYFSGHYPDGTGALWWKTATPNGLAYFATDLLGGKYPINGYSINYGGGSNKWLYYCQPVEGDVGVLVIDPGAAPYLGTFRPCSGGVGCYVIVKVYA